MSTEKVAYRQTIASLHLPIPVKIDKYFKSVGGYGSAIQSQKNVMNENPDLPCCKINGIGGFIHEVIDTAEKHNALQAVPCLGSIIDGLQHQLGREKRSSVLAPPGAKINSNLIGTTEEVLSTKSKVILNKCGIYSDYAHEDVQSTGLNVSLITSIASRMRESGIKHARFRKYAIDAYFRHTQWCDTIIPNEKTHINNERLTWREKPCSRYIDHIIDQLKTL